MFNRRTLLGLITATALIGTTSITMAADKPYIAIICKGFQAEFWQAVKAGAEQAGKDLNVDVNFEGPDGEGAVDHQLDMLSAELAKHPAAIGIAAIDSQAAVPVLQKFADAKIPIIAFDFGRRQRSAADDRLDRQPCLGGACCRQIGGGDQQ